MTPLQGARKILQIDMITLSFHPDDWKATPISAPQASNAEHLPGSIPHSGAPTEKLTSNPSNNLRLPGKLEVLPTARFLSAFPLEKSKAHLNQ